MLAGSYLIFSKGVLEVNSDLFLLEEAVDL